MIYNLSEYEKAREEIRVLEERLERLRQTHPYRFERIHKGRRPQNDCAPARGISGF